MNMTGIYRIALLPEADESEFVAHMRDSVLDILQPTRITRGFTHTLLKSNSEFRQYAWLAKANLVGDREYDYNRNRERIQKAIAKFGLLTGIEAYVNLETGGNE